jgi:uncharacterized membrane protein YesL
MSIFAQEGKLTRFLNRLGDLIWLNVLTILFCIPVVTIGAAVTAMYQVSLRMVKNEEGRIGASFVLAFKENFRQSTLIWLIGGGVGAFLAFDIRLLGQVSYGFVQPYKILLFVLLLFVLMFTVFALVTAARFENTLKNTIKNGILFCVSHIFKSVLMFAVMACPLPLLAASNRFLSVIVLIGVSGPGYLCSLYFRTLFKDYEGE